MISSKSLVTLVLLFIIAVSGCSKSGSSTPVQPTVLAITVQDSLGNPITGAYVALYDDSSDFLNQTAAAIIATATTDNTGVASFNQVSSFQYYFYASAGCKNNFNSTTSTAGRLSLGVTTSITTKVNSVGNLTLVNTSTNPYQIFTNGVLRGTVAGNSSGSIVDIVAGVVVVRDLQVSGYVLYPTDETTNVNIVCGETTTLTFP